MRQRAFISNIPRSRFLTLEQIGMYIHPRAQMAELVDALVSGTSLRKVMGVRVPLWALYLEETESKQMLVIKAFTPKSTLLKKVLFQ